LETYILSKRMENVINVATIAKINQQSAEAVYYHVQRTRLSTAVIITTGTSKRYAVELLQIAG